MKYGNPFQKGTQHGIENKPAASMSLNHQATYGYTALRKNGGPDDHQTIGHVDFMPVDFHDM